jgi:hypothetical protein
MGNRIKTRTVRADQVKRGHRVSKVPGGRVRRRRGQWPVVTAADYAERGERGDPTVYLELSDSPGWVFPLRPGEVVEVVTVLDDTALPGRPEDGRSRPRTTPKRR